MRKEIIKGLFEPVDVFCSCSVKEKSLWEYIKGVKMTKIWPLHTMHTRSNETIVESAGFVNWKCVVPEGACSGCTYKLRGTHIADPFQDPQLLAGPVSRLYEHFHTQDWRY
jgi:hypothetical protein